MNFAKSLKQFLIPEQKNSSQMVHYTGDEDSSLALNALLYGTKQNQGKEELTSSWVISAVRMVSTIAAQIDLEVWNTEKTETHEDDTRLYDHDLQKVIDNPNQDMGKAFLIEWTIGQLLLYGICAWYVVRSRKNKPLQFWPIESSLIKPNRKNGVIENFTYTIGKNKVTLERQDVLYFMVPSFDSPSKGLNRVSVIQQQLETDNLSVDWNRETFANEAVIKTMIGLPAEMQNKNYENAKKEIADQIISRSKRYIITRTGTIDIKQIGIPPKDLELLKGREFTRDEVDRLFGIPSAFWDKLSNRATSDSAREIVYEYTAWPLLRTIATEINSQIIKRFFADETITVRPVDTRPKRIEELAAKDNRERDAMTVNEVRISLGKKPYKSKYGDCPWPFRSSAEAFKLAFPEEVKEEDSGEVKEESNEKVDGELNEDIDKETAKFIEDFNSANYDIDEDDDF